MPTGSDENDLRRRLGPKPSHAPSGDDEKSRDRFGGRGDWDLDPRPPKPQRTLQRGDPNGTYSPRKSKLVLASGLVP